MSGLTLTLKPREKFLVGGHVVENGPRRGSIRIVDDGVFVLRLSDALHPDEVTTPVRRAYHAAQMILACAIAPEPGQADLLSRLAQLSEVFAGTPHADSMERIVAYAEAGRYHGVLTGLKGLMRIEETLLGLDDPAEEDARCVASGGR